MTKNMEKENFIIKMVILNMKEISLMTKEKEKGNIFMRNEKII